MGIQDIMAVLQGKLSPQYNHEMGQPSGVAQPQQLGMFKQMGQNWTNAGGIDALMGSPVFGAGVGMMAARDNPWQGALAGAYGSQLFKQRQEEAKMEREKFKFQQQQAEADQRLRESNRREAGKIYEKLYARANEDGVVDEWEQGMLSSAQISMESGESIGDLVKQMKPAEGDKPQSPIGKLSADLAAGRITKAEYDQEIAIRNKPLVEMNQPGQPLGAGAINWRNKAGEQPSPLLTVQDAVTQGFTPISPDARKAGENASQAAPMLGLVMGFGGIGTDKSLFAKDDANIVQRGIKGATSQFKTKTLDPSAPELIQYNTTKDATLAGIARLSGQVGTLTDLDVDTVRQLWPIPGFTTESVAKAQFKNIVGLLKARGLSDQHLASLGIPSEVVGSGKYDDLPEN